jgi:hypothetical protein
VKNNFAKVSVKKVEEFHSYTHGIVAQIKERNPSQNGPWELHIDAFLVVESNCSLVIFSDTGR